ncbi:nicotinate phosphoribosyltransferase [Spiroplasma endosymbiont of Crioceris asparagi]|uniref:nicotinate phosphoribosyltransferase n=1 Tax=Spiroplasma endosymbiont of Crioceris asparagi TaxID=3066286 RepID=UPI0030D1787D
MKYKINLDKRIIDNYYSADYFKKSRIIAKNNLENSMVTMQWFQRQNDVVVCGLEFIFEILRMNNLEDKIEVYALQDGDRVNEGEPVLKITGKYEDFIHFEGLFDGILSRATSIATNCQRISQVANGKTILNMNDRNDYFLNQQIDGYASFIGGIKNLVTEAATEVVSEEIKTTTGTMPHSLIALFKGDLIKALEMYKKEFPNNNLVALVDYNNDVINDSLKAAQSFGKDLFAVRVDTSNALIDKSLQGKKEVSTENHGVNSTLIKILRKSLDDNGFEHVKIIVSSGFDEEKIRLFEKQNVPVDIYGVGEAITKNKIHFTGDLVLVSGEEQSKVGRKNINSDKLKKINL